MIYCKFKYILPLKQYQTPVKKTPRYNIKAPIPIKTSGSIKCAYFLISSPIILLSTNLKLKIHHNPVINKNKRTT